VVFALLLSSGRTRSATPGLLTPEKFSWQVVTDLVSLEAAKKSRIARGVSDCRCVLSRWRREEAQSKVRRVINLS
jgi:hypothetical protein